MKMKNDQVLNRTRGSLVGLACGDYLGMPYEFKQPQKVKAYFRSHKLKPVRGKIFNKEVVGYYTDDTSQAICLAESLVEKGFDVKDQFDRYKKWFLEGYATPHDDKAYGTGQNTLRVLMRQTRDSLPDKLINNPKAGGNGALMRCAPVGLRYYKETASLIENSIKSAIITHNNEIAAWSCVVLNLFIGYALEGKNKETYCLQAINTIEGIPSELQSLLKTDLTKIDEDRLQTRGYSLYTLATALYAFLTTGTFEDCVTKAIAIGGDTDTQGAVSGALAGAYYGYDSIPKEWRGNLIKHEYIRNLAEKLFVSNEC